MTTRHPRSKLRFRRSRQRRLDFIDEQNARRQRVNAFIARYYPGEAPVLLLPRETWDDPATVR